MQKVKVVPLHERLQELGAFMVLRPYDLGNLELVFGSFESHLFGRALFEEKNGQITIAMLLEDQLKLALAV